METKISVTVPHNHLQDIISQIQERERIISEKIFAFESFREKTLIFLSFLFLALFSLVIVNLFFLFNLKRRLFLAQNFQENIQEKKNQKKKETKREIIETVKLQTNLPSCQTKNCLFFSPKKLCQLKEFSQKLINFSQSLNFENKTLKSHLLNLASKISSNCNFDEKSLLILKKRLKNIRNLLNKIKREKGVPKNVKKEIKILWDTAHSLSLKIAKFKLF